MYETLALAHTHALYIYMGIQKESKLELLFPDINNTVPVFNVVIKLIA